MSPDRSGSTTYPATGGPALITEEPPADSPGDRADPPDQRPGPGRSGLAAAALGTAGARVCALLISLVAGVLSAQALGPHDRGLLAVVLASSAIFAAVCSAGIDTASLRLAGRSPGVHRYAVTLSLRFACTVGLAISGCWALMATVVGPAVRLGLDPVTFAVTIVLCPVTLLVMLLGSTEIGRGRASVYNLVTVGSLGVYLTGLVVLVQLERATAATVAGAYALGQLGGLTALLLLGRYGAPSSDPSVAPEYRASARRAYLPNLAQFGMVRTQVPVIQILVGASAVGIYSVALALAEILLIVPIALSLVLVPAVANGVAQWRTVARLAGRTLAGTAAVAAALAVTGPFLVPLLYGDQFAPAVPVLWALLPGLAVFALARVAQSYLTATDRPVGTTTAAVAASLAGLAAMVVLIPHLGAVGAGLAASAGYAVYAAVVCSAFARARPAVLRARSVHRRRGRWARSGRRLAGWPESLSLVWSALALGLAGLAGLAATRLADRPDGTLVIIAFAVVALALVLAGPVTTGYALVVAAPAMQLPVVGAPGPALLLVLAGCALFGAVLHGRVVRRDRDCCLLVGALVTLLLISSTTSNPDLELLNVLMLVAVVAVPLICLPLAVTAGASARRMLLVFAFTSAGMGLVHTVGAIQAGDPAVTGVDVSPANRNVWGPMLVVALAVFLSRLTSPAPPLLRYLTVAALPVVLIAIGYSYSRSSYLGAVAVLFCFLVRRLLRTGLWLGVAVGGALLLGVTTPALPTSINDRISTTTAGGTLDVSSTVRLDLWSAAVRMALDHPVLGVGYLNFDDHLQSYFLGERTQAHTHPGLEWDLLVHPHNFFLTVVTETGLLGAVLLGVLSVLLGRAVWRGYRDRRGWVPEGAVLAAAGLAVCSMTGEPLLTLPVLIPFVLLTSTATRSTR